MRFPKRLLILIPAGLFLCATLGGCASIFPPTSDSAGPDAIKGGNFVAQPDAYPNRGGFEDNNFSGN